MFDTIEKKQVFINWLFEIIEADGQVTDDEIRSIKSVGYEFGMNDVIKTQELNANYTDNEKIFILRELYRVAISDLDFPDCEKKVILMFCDRFHINNSISRLVEYWALTYLNNEKTFYEKLEEVNNG